jgi:hypothetical protein
MAELEHITRYQAFAFYDLSSHNEDYKPDIFVVVQVWPQGNVAFAQFTGGDLEFMSMPMISFTDFKAMVEFGFMVEDNTELTHPHKERVKSYYERL